MQSYRPATNPYSMSDGYSNPSEFEVKRYEPRNSYVYTFAENVKFQEKARLWAERYYDGLELPEFHIRHRKLIEDLRPDAFNRSLAHLDAIFTGEKAQTWSGEDQTINKRALYKALRHLHREVRGMNYPSPIDMDGDWIMGYLVPTYPRPVNRGRSS